MSRLDLPERFDAVVGRWILMHTEDPVEVLRRAAAHLRPGGVLAVQDSDYSVSARCFAHPPTPTHDRLAAVLFPTALFPAATAGEGPVANLGLSLYGMFRQAGLPDPQLRLEAPLGGGEDWPGYAYLAETVASLLPALRALGVPGVDDIELAGLEARLRREVVERNGVQVLPTVIGAWARV
ncbi:MAG: class I SAM-dependent methyltransferase [Acidimicrobiales bacterium]